MKKLTQEEQEKLVRLVNYQANEEMTDEEFIAEISKISNFAKLFKTKNKILKIDFNQLSDAIFSEKLSVNTLKAQKNMKKQHRPIGTAPLGYKNIRSESGNPDIIVVPQIAENIVRLFELFSTGDYTLEMLANETMKWGIVGKRTGTPLKRQDVKRILKNKYYSGFAIYKGEQYRHRHPAIISLKLYKLCQKIGKLFYGKFW